jgi:hypothetical protein
MTTNAPIACERITLFIIYDCEMTTRHTLTPSEKIQLIRENEQKCKIDLKKYFFLLFCFIKIKCVVDELRDMFVTLI